MNLTAGTEEGLRTGAAGTEGDFRAEVVGSEETLLSDGGVSLRRPTGDDLEYLYKWENDPAVWPFGDCGVAPFGVSPSVSPVSPVSAVPVGAPAGAACAGGPSDGRGAESAAKSAVERFSREEIGAFIENQRHDIGVTGQVRFMIRLATERPTPPNGSDGVRSANGSADGKDENRATNDTDNGSADGKDGSDGDAVDATDSGAQVGFIDLFDYDEASRSAGVGILICEPHHRRRGYGGEALRLLKGYARRELTLRELWCDVAPDNGASLALFTAAGFRAVGQAPDGTTHLALTTETDR